MIENRTARRDTGRGWFIRRLGERNHGFAVSLTPTLLQEGFLGGSLAGELGTTLRVNRTALVERSLLFSFIIATHSF